MYKDPFEHERHMPFLRSRSQATYRGEKWELTFEEFCKLWNTPQLWHQRGRASQSLTLTRKNAKESWRFDNVEIITRREQIVRHRQLQIGKPYKKNKTTV
jgi:hypothetical protein